MLKTFVIGIFVGIANVIPGVSGGTLVVVFNIYDKFVNAITLNVKKLIKNWKFVVPIILGMGVGIVIFSKGITILFDRFPVSTNFFFTGLIIGSIPLLWGYTFAKDNKAENNKMPASKTVLLAMLVILGALLIYVFSYFTSGVDKASAVKSALPTLSALLIVKLFAGGILGAVAMIIPGLSGSLLMLVLGVYTIIISAISAMLVKATFISAVLILIPAGIGIVVGLFAGAKLISILIEKAPNYTYAVILGLIIGSALILFPGFKNQTILMIIINIVCILAGFSLAYFSTKFSNKEEAKV